MDIHPANNSLFLFNSHYPHMNSGFVSSSSDVSAVASSASSSSTFSPSASFSSPESTPAHLQPSVSPTSTTHEQVPRCGIHSDEAIQRIRAGLPVVLEDSGLAQSAVDTWTPDYLEKHLNPDENFNVFCSKNRFFTYWDHAKNLAQYQFSPPTSTQNMKFKEFLGYLRKDEEEESKTSEQVPLSSSATSCSSSASGSDQEIEASNQFYYLQSLFSKRWGKQILADFENFKWSWMRSIQQEMGWGAFTRNLLLVSPEKCITTTHYDEQENFFCQIRGRKKVLMFPPSCFLNMYAYPIYHPFDRQSQVDIRNPDLLNFPYFSGISPIEAELGPGDVLYIPAYYWHDVETLSESVSVTFWFKCEENGPAQIEYPISATRLVALRRNTEKLVAKLVSPKNMDNALVAISRPDTWSRNPFAPQLYQRISKLLIPILGSSEAVDDFLYGLVNHRYGHFLKEII